MPSKKKKYNARFPAGRIKKIMQTDEEIGKVAQAVPVIISRTLELFVESLLKRAMQITSAKNAKTLTPTHMKQCILSESRFDFLKDLVKGIPDVSSTDDEFGTGSGSLSPGTPLSGRMFSGYSSFQFVQSAESSSSKGLVAAAAAASQPPVPQASQPKFYKEIPICSEDLESRSDENCAPAVIVGTTVAHHTAPHLTNHCPPLPPLAKPEPTPSLRTISGRNLTQLNELKLSNYIKSSEYNRGSVEKKEEKEEEEDEQEDEEEGEDEGEAYPGENGYHKETSIAKTLTIDEDYDT